MGCADDTWVMGLGNCIGIVGLNYFLHCHALVSSYRYVAGWTNEQHGLERTPLKDLTLVFGSSPSSYCNHVLCLYHIQATPRVLVTPSHQPITPTPPHLWRPQQVIHKPVRFDHCEN